MKSAKESTLAWMSLNVRLGDSKDEDFWLYARERKRERERGREREREREREGEREGEGEGEGERRRNSKVWQKHHKKLYNAKGISIKILL
jgi:hypothetical protein